MPALTSSAYGIVENILLSARALCNDMEVPEGDVLTDDAPFSMQFVNLAYRRIQVYLAQYGVETMATYIWLLNIPANTTGDPESRVIINDEGTEIFVPSGSAGGTFQTPSLPDDLVFPLRLRERPNGSTLQASKMKRRNDGLIPYVNQLTYLCDWEFIEDSLQFRGALQNQDVELKYEKALPILISVNDQVPIRGVDNAAAYGVAYNFSKARGSMIADGFGAQGQAELDLLVNRSVRERQRINHRRRPFSRRRGTWGYGYNF